MPNPKFKLYIIALLIILGILILLVSFYASRRGRKEGLEIKNITSPTPFIVAPASKASSATKSEMINITPRFTGADEIIPEPALSAASQKQRLKKNLPVNTREFSIGYDYSSDLFVVALSEPKTENKTVLLNWLKVNYPDLALNKFLFK